jgi:hypothetical protein
MTRRRAYYRLRAIHLAKQLRGRVFHLVQRDFHSGGHAEYLPQLTRVSVGCGWRRDTSNQIHPRVLVGDRAMFEAIVVQVIVAVLVAILTGGAACPN